jgi:hypothetical protein
MRRLSLNRIPLLGRVGLLAALAGGIVLTVMSERATTCPVAANIQYKYAEPQHINHVGTRYVNCSPPYIQQEGTMTPYSVTEWLGDCGCCPAGCAGGCC